MNRSAATALATILLLAGCGGGGSGVATAGGGSGAPGGRGYAQVMAEAAALQAERAGQRSVGREALPAGGHATYGGYLTLTSPALPGAVVADLSLSIDFGDDETVGYAGNFVGSDGVRYEGTAYGAGHLATGPGRVTAVTALDGTIASGARSYNLGLSTRGDLLAPDGALIEGSATTRGGLGGADVTAAIILASD